MIASATARLSTLLRTGGGGLWRTAQQAELSSTSEKGGVYELRTYTIAPDKLGPFLALTKEKFHLRLAHSKLLGYHTAEMGGLSQVVHVWYYDSLSERAKVRAALAGDSKWTGQYLAVNLPAIRTMDNALLRPIASSDAPAMKFPETGGCELHTINFTASSALWVPQLLAAVDKLRSNSDLRVLGAWQTITGRLNTAVVALHHPNIDGVCQQSPALTHQLDGMAPLFSEWRTKLLLPMTIPEEQK